MAIVFDILRFMPKKYSRYQVAHPKQRPGICVQSFNLDQLTGAIIGHFKAQHQDTPMLIRARKGFNAVEGCNACDVLNTAYKKKAKAIA